jgi:hypothetical protein
MYATPFAPASFKYTNKCACILLSFEAKNRNHLKRKDARFEHEERGKV